MGQVSLPRLHKVNNGVFFESIYLSKTEMWQSIKIYLFLWNFINIFQFESLLLYKYSWNTVSIFTFQNFNISKNLLSTPYTLSNILQKTISNVRLLILNFYLVYIGGYYYGLIFVWPTLKSELETQRVTTNSNLLSFNTLLYY